MSGPAADLGIRSGAQWRPALVDGFQMGPARWNGEAVLGDVSVAGQRRILRIGLRERLIIEKIDGRRTVADIRTSLGEDGARSTSADVAASLNRMLAFGILQRPFEMEAQGLRTLDARAADPARSLRGVWAADSDGGVLRSMLGRLSRWPVFLLAALCGVAIAGGAMVAVPTVIRVITGVGSAWTATAAVLIAIVWNLAVTLLHEVAHVGTFRALSDRTARISVTRLGAIPMLNTQLDGIGLLRPSEKLRVVASGPLLSLIALAAPLTLLTLAPAGSFWSVVAAVALAVDLLVVGLSLSFFPNTDGTRVLEAISSVDQLQAVAFRTLFGSNRLPRALPAVTRIIVRVYPVLLVATVIAVLLVGVFTTLVALS